jgi:hypothetical protein
MKTKTSFRIKFVQFCVVFSIYSLLEGCTLDRAGVPLRKWLVSTAKDSASLGGTSKWKQINTSTVGFNPEEVEVSPILLGDFDGDNKADVFTTWGGKWRVSVAKDSASLGGTSKWKKINTSDVGVDDIKLGDFDGDHKADVFTTWGGKWRVSTAKDSAHLGGTSKWKVINTSDVGVRDVRLGDFDGDGKSDVFTTWGGKWRVSVAKDSASLGGTSKWKKINTSDVGVGDIQLGDFDRDRKADVFTTWGGKWRVSVAKDSASLGGTSKWKKINTSDVGVSQIVLGDFDADRKADVFTTWGGKWRVSVAKDSASLGATSKWKKINSSGVGFDLLFGDFDGDNKTDVFTSW